MNFPQNSQAKQLKRGKILAKNDKKKESDIKKLRIMHCLGGGKEKVNNKEAANFLSPVSCIHSQHLLLLRWGPARDSTSLWRPGPIKLSLAQFFPFPPPSANMSL